MCVCVGPSVLLRWLLSLICGPPLFVYMNEHTSGVIGWHGAAETWWLTVIAGPAEGTKCVCVSVVCFVQKKMWLKILMYVRLVRCVLERIWRDWEGVKDCWGWVRLMMFVRRGDVSCVSFAQWMVSIRRVYIMRLWKAYKKKVNKYGVYGCDRHVVCYSFAVAIPTETLAERGGHSVYEFLTILLMELVRYVVYFVYIVIYTCCDRCKDKAI